MKNLSLIEIKERLNETLNEIENWRNNIPKKLRPDNSLNNFEFNENIEVLKNKNDKFSNYKMIVALGFNVKYHHIKLMVFIAYSKYYYLEFGKECIEREIYLNPIISARCILKMSCIVDSRFGNYANYFIFYPFNAFLTICSSYIYLDNELNLNKFEIIEDFKLLIDCVKLHIEPFQNIHNKLASRYKLVSLILKSMLYATYKSCIEKYGEFTNEYKIDGIEILNDIDDIVKQNKKPIDLLDLNINYFNELKNHNYNSTKLPYFTTNDNNNYNNNYNNNSNNNDKTPTVSFLLSPDKFELNSNVSSHTDNELNIQENFFQNMMNIPNYFMDFTTD